MGAAIFLGCALVDAIAEQRGESREDFKRRCGWAAAVAVIILLIFNRDLLFGTNTSLLIKSDESHVSLVWGIFSILLALGGAYSAGKYCVAYNPVVIPRLHSERVGNATLAATASAIECPVAVDINTTVKGLLEAMPIKAYGSCDRRHGGSEDDDEERQNLCPLCLSAFESDTQVRQTPCKHIFCAACLEKQITSTLGAAALQCAICRSKFSVDQGVRIT